MFVIIIIINLAVDEAEDSQAQTPEAEPMDLDEEVTPTKPTIIEVNAPISDPEAAGPSSVTDPRLRSKKQTPLPSLPKGSSDESQIAAMANDELLRKAREQMAALAQMQQSEDKPIKSPSKDKIKFEWKKRK